MATIESREYRELQAEYRALRSINVDLLEALEAISNLDPNVDSTNGFNEWGEAECFRKAQEKAREAISKARG